MRAWRSGGPCRTEHRLVGAQVTEFARELRWDDVPAPVRRRLALLLIDLAAVSLAGRAAPAATLAADHAGEVNAGSSATALLDGRRLSVSGAAWANGVLANALDFDDGHRLTKGHPGAMVVPAALAAAEGAGSGVTEFLEAVLLGYEVALRAGVALHAREAQYHASAAWGALGAAVASGRLLGLDPAGLRHAVGIAEYHAPIALMPRAVADPAMTKDACGWGAMVGTSSALLARRGFTALDSEFMLDGQDLELGQRWELLEVYVKPYPCCRWTQPAIDASLHVHAPGEDPAAIESIVVRTFAAADLLSRRRPQSTEDVQYSLVWPVALALARGSFGVDEVLGGFDDPIAARLVERIHVEVVPEFTAAFPERRLSEVEVVVGGHGRRSGPLEAGGEPADPSWEDVILSKVRRQLDSGAAFACEPAPPPGSVSGRSCAELMALLTFGLAARPGGQAAVRAARAARGWSECRR